MLLVSSIICSFYHRKRQEAISSADKLSRIIRAKPTSTFLAFDIEVYEHDSDKMLEIGFVKFGLQPGSPREYRHYIITDNLHYVNGERVPDNRERFLFGESKRMTLREAAVQFEEHIAGAEFLVAHSGANDEHYLSMQGIDLQGKQIFDTQVCNLLLLILLLHNFKWQQKLLMFSLLLSLLQSPCSAIKFVYSLLNDCKCVLKTSKAWI